VTRALLVALALPAMTVSVVMGGCSSDPAKGYSFRSTFPRQVRTVNVPVFDNQTFFKGLEFDLTDAIIKEIQRNTPMVVVQSGSDGGGGGSTGAQTTLTGVIRNAELRDLTTSSRTALVQEMAQQVTIDFEWRDARTGQSLASIKDLRAIESFVVQRGVGERLETAQQQVAQELARKIVHQMRSEW